MAKRSKTQRAKASAKRAEKKEQARLDELQAEEAPEVEAEAGVGDKVKNIASSVKKSFVPEKTEEQRKEEAKAEDRKKAEKARKRQEGFFTQVRAEMKRVTWPTRQDIFRWSGVVVAALVFFGLYTFVLDNWVVTPLLVAVSSLGA